MSIRVRQYGISIHIGAAISLAVARWQGFAIAQPLYLNARFLSDGFFVAAVLLCGVGALMLISTTGVFDIFAYGFSSLLVLFTILRNPKDHISYYDYKMAKEARRGKPQRFLLFVGLGYFFLALLCWMFYYQLPS